MSDKQRHFKLTVWIDSRDRGAYTELENAHRKGGPIGGKDITADKIWLRSIGPRSITTERGRWFDLEFVDDGEAGNHV